MKPQPRKDATRGIISALPDLTKSPTVVDSVQSLQSIHVGNCTHIDSIDSSLAAADILGSKEPREHDTCPNSSFSLSESTRTLEGGNPSQLHATDTLQSDIAVPDGSEDWHSSFGKSLGEVKLVSLCQLLVKIFVFIYIILFFQFFYFYFSDCRFIFGAGVS